MQSTHYSVHFVVTVLTSIKLGKYILFYCLNLLARGTANQYWLTLLLN